MADITTRRMIEDEITELREREFVEECVEAFETAMREEDERKRILILKQAVSRLARLRNKNTE